MLTVAELVAKLRLNTADFDRRKSGVLRDLRHMRSGLLALAAASGVVSVAFTKMTKHFANAASDFKETTNVIDTTFKNSSREIEEWADTVGSAMGRSRQQMREFVGTSMAIFRPMLDNADAAKQMSIGVSQLAVDLGSFWNKADNRAMEALQAALIGNVRPMRAFGVNVEENTIRLYAQSQGIKTNIDDMTDQMKLILRYNYILEKTTDSQGDAQKTLYTYANQMKAFSGAVEDLSVNMGNGLLPAFEAILRTGTNVIRFFEGLSPQTQKTAAKVIAATAAVTALVTSMSLLAAAIGPLAIALDALNISFATTASFAAGFILLAASIGLVRREMRLTSETMTEGRGGVWGGIKSLWGRTKTAAGVPSGQEHVAVRETGGFAKTAELLKSQIEAEFGTIKAARTIISSTSFAGGEKELQGWKNLLAAYDKAVQNTKDTAGKSGGLLGMLGDGLGEYAEDAKAMMDSFNKFVESTLDRTKDISSAYKKLIVPDEQLENEGQGRQKMLAKFMKELEKYFRWSDKERRNAVKDELARRLQAERIVEDTKKKIDEDRRKRLKEEIEMYRGIAGRGISGAVSASVSGGMSGLYRGLLGDTAGIAVGEYMADKIGNSLEGAITGSGMQIGSLVGAAIGSVFLNPGVGAMVGSAVETGLLQLFDSIISRISSLDSRIGNIIGAAGDTPIASLASVALGPAALPAGMLGSMLFEAAKQTESFSLAQEKAAGLLDVLFSGLEPLFKNTLPALSIMAEIARTLMANMLGPMEMLGQVMGVQLFLAAKGLAAVLGLSAAGMAKANEGAYTLAAGFLWLNGVVFKLVEQLATLLSELAQTEEGRSFWQDAAERNAERANQLFGESSEMSSLAGEQGEIARGWMEWLDNLMGTSYAEAMADMMDENTEALNENTKALNNYTLNLPAGYRVEGAVFGSTAGGAPENWPSGPVHLEYNIQVERVVTGDPEDFIRQLEYATQTEAQVTAGGSGVFGNRFTGR